MTQEQFWLAAAVLFLLAGFLAMAALILLARIRPEPPEHSSVLRAYYAFVAADHPRPRAILSRPAGLPPSAEQPLEWVEMFVEKWAPALRG